MSPHVKKIRKFMKAFGSPKEVAKILWTLYEAALNSEMANSWDKNKRADLFFFVKTLVKFFEGFTVVYELTEATMEQKKAEENNPSY